MRGEQVLVRAFGDRPLVRVIWDWDPREDVVYITDEAGLKKLMMGKDGAMAIGFHRADVFSFNRETAELVQAVYASNRAVDWSCLTRWGSEKA